MTPSQEQIEASAKCLEARQCWEVRWYVDMEQLWERRILAETAEEAMEYVRMAFPSNQKVDFICVKTCESVVVLNEE